MNKFSVCHLSKFYKPFCGGIESVVADIAEGSHFCNTSVIAADQAGLPAREIINAVRVVRSKEYFNIAKVSIAPGYISDVFRECNGQILHVHLPNPLATVALMLARVCGKNVSKLIVHWHSDVVKQKFLKILFWPFEAWLLRKAKIIVVTSQRYLESSESLSQFVDKCVVVPIGISSIAGGINLELVRDLRHKYSGKKIIFSLGRHVYYKGFEDLIEAAKYVSDAVFVIGGSGPDTEKYRMQIAKGGLDGKVYLVGRVPDRDLPSYYAAADVFCLPSNEKSEAFGVVQLEAMSIGTPVVSANIIGSGVPWVNTHMESGLVYDVNNVQSLAQSLNLIINDQSLRESLSLGAKRRFRQYFTRDKSIEAIHSVYKKILCK
jgi:glycosyltransferase involved in cell wall biosynthesis